jgi:hypothetical protein
MEMRVDAVIWRKKRTCQNVTSGFWEIFEK